jgi:hypothetical protein
MSLLNQTNTNSFILSIRGRQPDNQYEVLDLWSSAYTSNNNTFLHIKVRTVLNVKLQPSSFGFSGVQYSTSRFLLDYCALLKLS